MPDRRLTLDPLRVQSHLAGAPLASPARRVLAFVIDWMLVIVPTVAASLLFAVLAVYIRDRAAFDAGWNFATGKAATAEARRRAAADLVPLLADVEPEGMPHDAAVLIEEQRFDEAVARLADYDFRVTVRLGEFGGDHVPLPPKTIQVAVDELIPVGVRGMAVFLVPAAYFTAFTRGRRGATPGKRLTRIQVVRLDGERLTWLEALERFIGYLHVPGTFFIGLRDLWHDPNRRLPHDRVAHTAVIRVTRSAPRPAPMPSPA